MSIINMSELSNIAIIFFISVFCVEVQGLVKPILYGDSSECKCIPDSNECNGEEGFKISFSFSDMPRTCLPHLYLCCESGLKNSETVSSDNKLDQVSDDILNQEISGEEDLSSDQNSTIVELETLIENDFEQNIKLKALLRKTLEAAKQNQSLNKFIWNNLSGVQSVIGTIVGSRPFLPNLSSTNLLKLVQALKVAPSFDQYSQINDSISSINITDSIIYSNDTYLFAESSTILEVPVELINSTLDTTELIELKSNAEQYLDVAENITKDLLTETIAQINNSFNLPEDSIYKSKKFLLNNSILSVTLPPIHIQNIVPLNSTETPNSIFSWVYALLA